MRVEPKRVTPSEPSTEVEARPPARTEALRVGAKAEVAAGIPAVLSTLRYTWRQTSLRKGSKLLLHLNQADGFDCQSCAWPNPEHRHVAEFCENGARAALDEGTDRRVDARFFAAHAITELSHQSDHWLNQQGRLTEPMIKRAGATHYAPIGWDDAFRLIADTLRALATPDEAVFYTSGRTSNEAAFLYQLMVRRLGTNNLPDCSNMCHESSGAALTKSLGVGKGTVTLDDFEAAQLIFIIGQNPGTNHPRMLTSLQAAKRNGCRIVHVNPLPEAGTQRFKNPQEPFNTLLGGTRLADLFLQVRVGGDMAVFKGIGKALLEAEAARGGVLDRAFVDAHTAGFEAYRAELDATSWEAITRESGLAERDLRSAADEVAAARNIICCWAMGLTQQPHAVATIREVVNVLLLRGSVGRAGSGVCPVRGHSNVQGDRTMGIWEKPPAPLLDAIARELGFAPPRAHGLDVVNAIRAMHDGRAKVLFAMGGNFLSATPDTDYTAEALSRCRLTVHVSTKLNRAHLVTGETALIFPCLGRSEIDTQESGPQFVTVEDSMGIISASRGVTAPASRSLRSEPAIVAGLARALFGDDDVVPWRVLGADYGAIRARIAKVIPGFEDFERRIGEGSFLLPNPARDGRFVTDTGKANFSAHPLPTSTVGEGELVMMTIRSHDQFNTTIYGLDDRYRGIYNGRRVILMHADDLHARGLEPGDEVDITSHFRGVTRRASGFRTVAFSLPRGAAATYFPEGNALVPVDSVAAESNQPTSKYVRITVARAASALA
ncbi:MAG: FdhF/YdeP family oxidoreductase [Polyangiales bacterium]